MIGARFLKEGKDYWYLWKDNDSWWKPIGFTKRRPSGVKKYVLNGWKREYNLNGNTFTYEWWYPKPKNQQLGDLPEDFIHWNLEDWLPLLQADFQKELVSQFRKYEEEILHEQETQSFEEVTTWFQY